VKKPTTKPFSHEIFGCLHITLTLGFVIPAGNQDPYAMEGSSLRGIHLCNLDPGFLPG